MRLPWIQVDQDGLTRCRLLARLLGIPETQGIGLGVALWQYALESAADGDFAGLVPDSGILAAVVGWDIADGARLIESFQRVGLVATEPRLRVRGLDRYRRAWEKNTRKKAKPADSGGRVPETGANHPPPAPVSARQTQTQIEKKQPAPASRSRDSDLLVLDFKAIIGADYFWQGAKDGVALARLLKAATLDEVRRRWILGLRAPESAWASCRTVAQLASKWNDLAAAKPDTSIPKGRQL